MSRDALLQYRVARDRPPQLGSREPPGPPHDDRVLVVFDFDLQHAGKQRAHGSHDLTGFVEGVAHQQPPAREPRLGELVSRRGKPAGFVHAAPYPDKDILEDQIEAPLVFAQKIEGIGDHHLEFQRIEIEMLAGRVDYILKQLHTHDVRIRRDGPHDPRRAPARHAENQDFSAAPRRQRQQRRGDRVPDRSGHRTSRPIPGGESALYAKREAGTALAHFDPRAPFAHRSTTSSTHCAAMTFGLRKRAYNCAMTDSLFAAPSLGLVRVALPVPIDSLFDYRVPEPMDANAQPGHRVQVRFSGRPLVGLICERLPESSREAPSRVGELASLDKVIDSEPVLSLEMIRMLGEAAAEILCPIGIAHDDGAAPRLRTPGRATAGAECERPAGTAHRRGEW